MRYDINNVEVFGWHIAPGGYALVGMYFFSYESVFFIIIFLKRSLLSCVLNALFTYQVLLLLLGLPHKPFLAQSSYSKSVDSFLLPFPLW